MTKHDPATEDSGEHRLEPETVQDIDPDTDDTDDVRGGCGGTHGGVGLQCGGTRTG